MTDPKPSAEEWAAQITSDVWDRPSIETREEFQQAIESALSAAVSEAVESTVREAAKALCAWCSDGEAVEFVDKRGRHPRDNYAPCYASLIWSRWPALAPKEEK